MQFFFSENLIKGKFLFNNTQGDNWKNEFTRHTKKAKMNLEFKKLKK